MPYFNLQCALYCYCGNVANGTASVRMYISVIPADISTDSIF